MNVGSIPAGQEPEGFATLIVVGFDQVCWRCRQVTTCVVGFTRPGRFRNCQMILTELDQLLRWAGQLLPDDVRLRERVGVIKDRYSRTAGSSYLSNGCFHCDALQGAMPLSASLAERIESGQDTSGLRAVHQVQLPIAWWDRLEYDYGLEQLVADVIAKGNWPPHVDDDLLEDPVQRESSVTVRPFGPGERLRRKPG